MLSLGGIRVTIAIARGEKDIRIISLVSGRIDMPFCTIAVVP